MSDGDICPICCDNLESDICILLCGHKYHNKCILSSYNSEIHNSRSGVIQRRCPYCRQNGGYLGLEPYTIPIKGIHKEYNEFRQCVEKKDIERLKVYLNHKKCFAILKSGINKGSQCSNKPDKLHYYCKKHS
jgi:hypothetical protein